MENIKTYLKRTLSVLAIVSLAACNDDFLDKLPETEIGAESFFNTEEDLSIYINSLYNFPGTSIYYADEATDNTATTGNREIKTIMMTDANSTTITGGWEWEDLRNINFFLEYADKANVTDEIRNHYIGVARFFRANFYMHKVKRYSNVPWYDFVLGTSDEDLFKASDSRETVVQHIFEDYQFAFDNVMTDQPDGAVNKWVVGAMYSRNALHEGTFRKYHSELGLESSANTYLQLAATVSKEIMDSGSFSIYNTGNPESDYHSLFESQDLTSISEIILTNIHETDVKDASDTQTIFGGYEMSPARDLLETYLMADGSYFSDQPNSDTMTFVEEFQNRDPRLSQTYAYPGWELYYTSTYSPGNTLYVQEFKKNFTGYHQIKGFVNDPSNNVQNNIDIPVLRYAEILLNYAEAKAELGTLAQSDLDISINVLRDRANMPHLTMGVTADPIQAARYSEVSSAVLLEIRRERRVEMAFEGRRLDDLNRWGAGKLMEKEPIGMYFPGLGRYDLTGDGVDDIVLLDLSDAVPDPKETNSLGAELIYYTVAEVGNTSANVYLTNGTSGYIVGTRDRGAFDAPKHYYRPVPASEVALNPNLDQVFGWE
ncbi:MULTISPECIES: RagB/SusD family nutrient uptake outer membrane protein [Flavobacteriaceae]|uniref:RagB/SusD family nutrient uptake outer membrane protein n=1 Tax=Flavobacteriaceae TaxID=49546 RepID=UPI0014914F7A|nr:MULTISPECIES: RagB/SusD family nutrient uptake outer membrane protein [Allomuricauda]MDC6365660.1 RagB/SusD family nutrient uptake outer membrane protein [Muricauda sp. AC10]